MARTEEMAELYREGCTLQEIGDRYGISRERVRQVLRAANVAGYEGGAAVLSAAKRADRMSKLEARFQKKYGMPRLEVLHLRRIGATGRYQRQRENAKKRGIEWKLSLSEWWKVWDDSGKWNKRGRSKDMYVMSRVADNGAYEIGNVMIITASQNHFEYRKLNNPDWQNFLNWACERFVMSGLSIEECEAAVNDALDSR